jgi:L-threonylcarbamoyladenylate synthase
MDTSLLPANSEESIQKALDTLRSCECVAFPTDTVYGLGADPFNISAIIKIFEAKGREFNKAIAILVGNLEQVDLITNFFTESARKLVGEFWPGGLTVIVPKSKEVPDLLSENLTIGIRMPNHPVALRLLNDFGPLATTSANLSGKQNPLDAVDVHIQLNGRIPLILDGGRCPGGVPSTIVDCTGEEIQILRKGAVSEENIHAVLSDNYEKTLKLD